MTNLTITREMARTVSAALLAPVHVEARKIAAELDNPIPAGSLFADLMATDETATAETLELIRLSREAVGLPCDADMCVQCWADLIDMYRSDTPDADGFIQGALGDA